MKKEETFEPATFAHQIEKNSVSAAQIEKVSNPTVKRILKAMNKAFNDGSLHSFGDGFGETADK